MPAGLALSKADVTPDGGPPMEGVSVLVRRGKAQLRRGRELLTEAEGVESVVATARTSWTVTFTGGATWQVKKIGCVPCSGRR